MRRTRFESILANLSAVVLVLVFLLVFNGAALAQNATSSVSGRVVDSDGGVIPGASVDVKQDSTGVTTTILTNEAGFFSVPGLPPGSYTVTVSLPGFKSSVFSGVRLITGNPSNLGTIPLAVGAVEESVSVSANTDLVQTQVATVTSTMGTEQLSSLPMPSRNVPYDIAVLPGVESTGGNARNTVISGLPMPALSVTLDGLNVQSQLDKTTDGAQGNVRTTLDALEEVTVNRATQDSSAGGGAAQIQFTTRSGTDQFHGTVYEYYRDSALNTNYFFDSFNGLSKPINTLNQYGASLGGPIKHGKLFFFFNVERLSYNPQTVQNRTVLNALGQTGIFQYGVSGNQVNLLALAAQKGQIATVDPTIANLLSQVSAASQLAGQKVIPSPTNPIVNNYTYNFLGFKRELYPTLRVDFNISPSERLSFVTLNETTTDRPLGNPVGQFPGAAPAVSLQTTRHTWTGTLRSTLNSHAVNVFVAGMQRPPHNSDNELNRSFYTAQQGFQLTLGSGLSNITSPATYEQDLVPNLDINDTLSWLKGAHSLSVGLLTSHITYKQTQGAVVPTVTFGVQTGVDPADSMFTTANFPGASATDLTNARSLYALLTGRITAINGAASLANGSYVYMGLPTDRTRMDHEESFFQDSWRVRSALTVNAGVRWTYQTPVVPLSTNYSTATFDSFCGVSGVGNGPAGRGCNLFAPGTLSGSVPFYSPQPTKADYSAQWGNFAPNFSAAWQPGASTGLWRALLGNPGSATIRGGYSKSFVRYGMSDFATVFAGNPGETVTANRTFANGNLIPTGTSAPLLLSNTSNLGAPPTCAGTVTAACIPASPTFPAPMTIANNVTIFDPNLKLASASSYSLGLQREITHNMAVEVQYVGTRSNNNWQTENWNEVDVTQNGFLDEFKLAQANLQANVAAGRGGSFAYFGSGTGTSPLPIMLASLNGVSKTQANDPTKYTGSTWTNTTLSGYLAKNQPQAVSFASDTTSGLYGNATFRANAIAAGMPANFWVMNPNTNQANIVRSIGYTRYNSIQFNLRRRFSQGLQFDTSYVYAQQQNSAFASVSRSLYTVQAANVPHSAKFSVVYELPVGKGKRFGNGLPLLLDAISGGWTASATGRFYRQYLSASGVRLVGMTQQDLQSAFKVRIDSTTKTVYMFPDDIVTNTRRAFNASATDPSGYGALGVPVGRYIAPASTAGCVEVFAGDCGEAKALLIEAPIFHKVDLTLKKRFNLEGKKNVEIQFDLLNLGGAINFTPVFNPGSSATIFQTTSGYTSATGTFEPGGQIGQLMLRFSF